jgi:Uncharacterized conserved protein (DUF2183)
LLRWSIMGSIRNRTGHCMILFALGLGACAGTEDEVEDLGPLVDGKTDSVLPRVVELDLADGTSKRFRIVTAAFVASLEQTGMVDAQLTAKHYSLNYASDIGTDPSVFAEGDGTSRNWTLTVHNRGNDVLDGTLVIDVPRDTGQLGIVSDIDKTVLPPETAAGLPAPYPGVATLFRAFDGTAAGDLRWVTARGPDRIVDLPDWMDLHDFPVGTFDTGLGGQPWVVQPEKIADIERIFDASGDQRFVLVGDTSQRDPEVYKAIRTKYPTRVAAIIIHKMNTTVNPTRVVGMHLVDNYAQAAALAFGDDLLTEAEAREVMEAAKTEGLAITDAEIDALIDANR